MDFTVAADFQAKLDWMSEFVRAEVEPLDLAFPSAKDMYDTSHKQARALVAPLREQVKAQELWACHRASICRANARRHRRALRVG
jgi:acyl-CoA dehydrogenase